MTMDGGTVTRQELVSLQALVTQLIESNDRRYEQRFLSLSQLFDQATDAQKEAVTAALAASDKAVQAAFLASEKAVQAAFLASEKASAKAEEAQSSYNERSNEFRGQLDDQAKTLMPRAETMATFKAYDDKLDAVKTELQQLRDYRYGAEGRVTATSNVTHDSQAQNNWRVTAAIAAIGMMIAVAGFILALAHP